MILVTGASSNAGAAVLTGCPCGLPPCTSFVRVMGFRVHCVHLGHFEICNLHIPNRPFISWFESMPGSQIPKSRPDPAFSFSFL